MRHVKVLCCTLWLFLAACTSGNPQIFLSDPKCALPCWYGLTVGNSTKEGSLTVLQSLPFASQSSIKVGTVDPNYVSWRFTDNAMGQGNLYFSEQGVLTRILLTPIGLNVGRVVDTFGPPENVWVAYRRQPNGLYYQVTLYYSQKGIAVTSGDKARNGVKNEAESIPRDLTVLEVNYFSPTDIRDYLTQIAREYEPDADSIMSHLQPWPGFGENVIQIKP